MMTTKYHGIDKDPEISLFEYGLLVSNEPDDDGQYHCIYAQKLSDASEEMYGWGYLAEHQLPIGESWQNFDEFLDYVGMEYGEWDELPFVHKLSDLISYYGVMNIIGYTNYPLNKAEVIEFFKKKEQ